MPYQLNPANGKWESSGPVPTGPAPGAPPPTPIPAPPKPKRVEEQRRNRPWWEMLPGGRYIPGLGGIDNLRNDITYEVKQLTNPKTALPRVQSHLIDITTAPMGAPGVINENWRNTNKLGTQKAATNATKAILEPLGLLTPRVENYLDEQSDAFYEASGFTPPSEMDDAEKAGDDARASLMLNLSLAGLTGGVSAKLQTAAFVTRFPALARTLQLADPTKAKTMLGALTRFGFANAVDEIPSTFFDDNTGGSAIALLGFLGVKPETVRKLDPVKPGMTRTEASIAALGPNFATSLTLAGGLMGLSRLLPNAQRALKSQTARTTRQAARDQLEADGVIATDSTGRSSFGEAIQEAEEELLESAEDAVEIDALTETIESQLDDAAIDEVITRSETEPVPAVVEEIAQRVQPDAVNPDMRYDAITAPTQNLAPAKDPVERFSAVPLANLRSLADPSNSPELALEIAQLTGRTGSEVTRTDIINGITALESKTGRTVMPSRMMGQPIVLVSEIAVDPKRFQYKMGTDAKTGRQKGHSISDVEAWNEVLEGSVQVWVDPMDGKTYVVNGHNRVEKAEDLGILSLRVEYINAPTAEAARAEGALRNIADARGTAFDAAKFFRQQGITDPIQFKPMGLSMESGLATKGLALSKLPDNIFQDAIDGRIKLPQALALGGSGLDETGMQQAYKVLLSRDLSESTFSEVLQQARSATTVQGDQVDLFGNTDMLNLMVEKGKLAAAIEQGLGKTRRAANSAAKNVDTLEGVGSRINKEGTKSLADDTKALIAKFKADKYMESRTSQLLNEGAEQIHNGARPEVVANRIRRQLIEEAETTPAPAKPAEAAAPGLNEMQIKKLEGMTLPQLTAEKTKLKKMVLGDRARTNRIAKKAQFEADSARQAEWFDDDTALVQGRMSQEEYEAKWGPATDEEPPVFAPPKAESARVDRELEQDSYARLALKWIQENRPELTRRQKISQIATTAAKKGEARPPSTPLPDSPAPGNLDLGNDPPEIGVLKVLDNEARIGEEFDAIDNALAGDRLEAERAASGYNEMTFDEKKGNGLLKPLEGANETPAIAIPESAGRKITEKNERRVAGQAETLMKWANAGRPPEQAVIRTKQQAEDLVRAKGQLLDTGKVPGLDVDQALNDFQMGRTTPATEAMSRAYRDFYGAGGQNKTPAPAPTQGWTAADIDAARIPWTKTRQPFEAERYSELTGVDIDLANFEVKDKGAFFDPYQVPGLDADQAMLDVDKGLTTPAAEALKNAYLQFYKGKQTPAPAKTFTMPAGLSKSTPRFGMAQLKFESDLDRAAYMLRNKAKKSKGEDALIASLETQGFDVDEIRRLGDDVKTRIQNEIEQRTGSRRAPQENVTIEVPASKVQASMSSPRTSIVSGGPYDEGRMREWAEKQKAEMAKEEEDQLLDLGFRITGTVAQMTRLNEGLAREMVRGLKDAARISGLDPKRLRYLDTIPMRQMFGEEASNLALERWRPDEARFARENPGDPLIDVIDPGPTGVYVPMSYPSAHRHMIFLALGPNLDKRLADPAMFPGSGAPMTKVAYHEAFHAVQNWLDEMTVKLDPEASSLRDAINRPEALDEMRSLLKKSPIGMHTEGMAPDEIQAEAFAIWYNNRKIRLKTGGLQAAFETIKKFINNLRRKWRTALKQDPTYVDVFELAAEGKIADKGWKTLDNLTDAQLEGMRGRIDPTMDALLPDLTDRVARYLDQKRQDYDLLMERLEGEFGMEGC